MERLINRSPSKSYIDNSIVCDKCHKRIEYNYYSGYGHRCSGCAEEIRRAAHRRFYSINSLRNRDAQIFEMYDLAGDLDSTSVVYDPEADKLLRKEIEMKNPIKDYVPTREEIEQKMEIVDLTRRLGNSVVMMGDPNKNSTPKIGELCGMDLLVDLSNAPDEVKYELYFKARTVLEEVMAKLAK